MASLDNVKQASQRYGVYVGIGQEVSREYRGSSFIGSGVREEPDGLLFSIFGHRLWDQQNN
jgi:hypothetical protein